jgi:hypothetical protein
MPVRRDMAVLHSLSHLSAGKAPGDASAPAHQAVPPPPSPAGGHADVRDDDGFQLIEPEEEGPLSTLHVFDPASAFRTGWPGLFPDAHDEGKNLCLRLLGRGRVAPPCPPLWSATGSAGWGASLSHNRLVAKGRHFPRRIPARAAHCPTSTLYTRMVTRPSQGYHRTVTAGGKIRSEGQFSEQGGKGRHGRPATERCPAG